jgi:predicted Zn-ribbon and HTH transcriptional regulator
MQLRSHSLALPSQGTPTPPPRDTSMAPPSPLTPTREVMPRPATPPQSGRGKANRGTSTNVDPSVFDIQNIFRRRWFLSRANLVANVISAQKAEDGDFSWVEFTPQYHSHLVKCAVALVPYPVPKVKKVMFVYILELLNRDGNEAFFNLQKGGRKANNAQKEKRRLARKRSRAAKREREREAVKMAHQPPHEWQCRACGRKFNSRKTARKHTCPNFKVVRTLEKADDGWVSRPTPTSNLDKPEAQPAPPAPTAPRKVHLCPSMLETPPHTTSTPAVTEGSQNRGPTTVTVYHQAAKAALFDQWKNGRHSEMMGYGPPSNRVFK